MRFLAAQLPTLIHAALSTLILALLGAADYYGFAVFGESPEQQKPGQQTHIMQRFHK